MNRPRLGCKVLLSAGTALGIWLAAAAPVGAVTIDTQTRTVTAARLSMAFGALEPDVVRSLQWTDSAGTQGETLVDNTEEAICPNAPKGYPANFWGESYGDGSAGTNPELVFGGSNGSWSSPAPDQVQSSTEYPVGCSKYKEAVPVGTTYTYYDTLPQANEIMLKRTWSFALSQRLPAAATGFRAYVPQLPLTHYGQVLYPNAGSLQTETISPTNCGKSACLKELSGAWFAINDGTAGDSQDGSGMIVLRDASDIPGAKLAIQGTFVGAAFPNPIANLSSIDLPVPNGGLGAPITEIEYLCFYDATSWPQAQREALQLPPGCGPLPSPPQEGGGATTVPPPGKTPPPGPAPGPSPPVLGHSFNVARAGGVVLVEPPGTHTFTPLTQALELPLGSIIDATHGSVSITTATPGGGTQTGQFFAGRFVLTQGRDGAVVATLTGGDFSVCPTARERRHLAHASSGHASGKHVVRKLWANAHGKFSTKGNYAAGAVQGTEWLTEDLCEGTLIRVTRDRVAVTNLVNHRHLTVKAGHRYLAKAP
ncbi:MAG TPA: hypothetical protein VIC06_07595 [Solirubrobacteraceae bacterium]|jgi:hypothetical protein